MKERACAEERSYSKYNVDIQEIDQNRGAPQSPEQVFVTKPSGRKGLWSSSFQMPLETRATWGMW